jgi:hypothetical protein
MNAARTGRPAYWPCAGTVMSRRGALADGRPLVLFRFHGREAWRCRRLGDAAGARHCAELAVELAAAMVRADDWRRAATGEGRSNSPITALRVLTRDLKPGRYG